MKKNKKERGRKKEKKTVLMDHLKICWSSGRPQVIGVVQVSGTGNNKLREGESCTRILSSLVLMRFQG